MREREYKFLLKRGRELPGPNKLVKGLGTYSLTRRHQEAVYYDTADLRLTRAGASLRFRSDDGWTVKLPEHQHGLLERDEIVLGFLDAAGRLREAVALVHALSRSAPLDKVATVTTDRQEMRIVDRHGRPVGSIDDDRVRAKAVRTGSTSFHEVEFEVASDADVRAGRRGRRTVAQSRREGRRPAAEGRTGARRAGRGTRPTWSPAIDSAVAARRATSCGPRSPTVCIGS